MMKTNVCIAKTVNIPSYPHLAKARHYISSFSLIEWSRALPAFPMKDVLPHPWRVCFSARTSCCCRGCCWRPPSPRCCWSPSPPAHTWWVSGGGRGHKIGAPERSKMATANIPIFEKNLPTMSENYYGRALDRSKMAPANIFEKNWPAMYQYLRKGWNGDEESCLLFWQQIFWHSEYQASIDCHCQFIDVWYSEWDFWQQILKI